MGEVEGKVEEGVGGAGEAFAGDFLAGVSGGGEEDDFIGVFRVELGEEGFDGEDFADGDGVDPDYAGILAGEGPRDFGRESAGAFAKAVEVFILAPAAEGVVGAEEEHADGEENVVEEVHDFCVRWGRLREARIVSRGVREAKRLL